MWGTKNLLRKAIALILFSIVIIFTITHIFKKHAKGSVEEGQEVIVTCPIPPMTRPGLYSKSSLDTPSTVPQGNDELQPFRTRYPYYNPSSADMICPGWNPFKDIDKDKDKDKEDGTKKVLNKNNSRYKYIEHKKRAKEITK